MTSVWDTLRGRRGRRKPELAIPPLDGPFRQNDDLESAWVLLELLDLPDDVVAGADKFIYLSVNGAVLRFDHVNSGRAEVFAKLNGPGGGLAVGASGDVAVCVADHGVVVFDREGKLKFSLTKIGTNALRSASAVTFLDDGSLVIAEASTSNRLSDWQRDFLEFGESGRIIRWWPEENRTEILAEGLAFPHGLCLAHDKTRLLFTEAWNYSVSSLALESDGAEPVLELSNLPGYPARIRQSEDGGYWLSFLSLRSALVEFVRKERAYCAEMMRTVSPEFWVAPSLVSTAYDHHPWKSPFFMKSATYFTPGQIGSIRRSAAINPWAPTFSYGLVAKLDHEIQPVMSFHSRANNVYHGMTGLCEKDGGLFIACKGYGALLKCSTVTGIERASEAVEKRKKPRERIRSFLDGQGAVEVKGDAVPIVRVSGATKYYGSAPAIDGVDFVLYKGEVHALLGENGAGKSTLCKALAGAIELTSGEIAINGAPTKIRSSSDALRQGIAMVYQETSLVPYMTVAQNIVLGNERKLFRTRQLHIEAAEFLSSINFSGIDVTAVVSGLGQGHKQMVEIARALYNRAKVIIFDEPTSALSPGETTRFFELIEMLKRQGIAIVFISHNIEEAMDLAERMTVMRDGRVVASDVVDAFSRSSIVAYMVGREGVSAHYTMLGRTEARRPVRKKKILSVENLRYSPTVKNMTFSVYAGEITCIAGLVGSGRSEAARVIAGALKRDISRGGNIYLDGKPVSYRQPIQAIRDGIVYVTEDRKIDGFFETMGIPDNIFMGEMAKADKKRVFISNGESLRISKSWIERLQIHSIDMQQPVNRLSGGNQQKVVLGKSLIQKPRLIIVDEPTRGVDVGAIAEIHQLLRSLVTDDVAVVVISSYLPEVLKLADRVLVARQGQIVAEFASSEATEAKIMAAALS